LGAYASTPNFPFPSSFPSSYIFCFRSPLRNKPNEKMFPLVPAYHQLTPPPCPNRSAIQLSASPATTPWAKLPSAPSMSLLSVANNEFLAPSALPGSGKSTLRISSPGWTAPPPDRFSRTPKHRISQTRSSSALPPQHHRHDLSVVHLLPRMTLEENVELSAFASPKSIGANAPPASARPSSAYASRIVFGHRPPELSGGEQQRSPSPAPSSIARKSSSPTSPPAISIPPPVKPSSPSPRSAIAARYDHRHGHARTPARRSFADRLAIRGAASSFLPQPRRSPAMKAREPHRSRPAHLTRIHPAQRSHNRLVSPWVASFVAIIF